MKLLGGLLMGLMALVFLTPLLLVVMNSFKTLAQYSSSILSWPDAMYLGNYQHIFAEIDYPRIYANSIAIELISVAGIVLVSSMAASKVARVKGRLNSAVYLLLLLSMVIPFQARMLTLMSVVGALRMSNSLIGMSVLHIATLSPPVFFMYVGAMKSVPFELEEAARIDGAGAFALFLRITFPLLRAMTLTVSVLFGLVVWNSFLLPMLVLTLPGVRTIPLAVYKFYSAYGVNWVQMFASIVVGALPIYAVFLLMQKYIVSGISAGAVKG